MLERANKSRDRGAVSAAAERKRRYRARERRHRLCVTIEVGADEIDLLVGLHRLLELNPDGSIRVHTRTEIATAIKALLEDAFVNLRWR